MVKHSVVCRLLVFCLDLVGEWFLLDSDGAKVGKVSEKLLDIFIEHLYISIKMYQKCYMGAIRM